MHASQFLQLHVRKVIHVTNGFHSLVYGMIDWQTLENCVVSSVIHYTEHQVSIDFASLCMLLQFKS